MKVPYQWLREYVDTDLEPGALADKLTMAGLEVDRVEERWPKIVTAKITFLEPVKGSHHLNATRVTTGDGTERSVVCGAPNIHLGDVVPLALPGAVVQAEGGESFTISSAKKMGVLSDGMLCSPRELGLSNDHQGIFVLPPETPLGMAWEDAVIELDIKAHRGDLFGMVGIAREVAAIAGTALKPPPTTVPERGKTKVAKLAQVTVVDADLCPRFTARVIQGVRLGPSPLWMVLRLAAAGMRSINNVVDITNYVMLETGQPLHAFDYDHVAGHHLTIRRAKAGEHITTLDGQDRALDPDMMLVCDDAGPSSIAGVMGGALSEVADTTTNILLESATWDGGNIRRTSTKLGLRSEASSRNEKGLDPELARVGLDRAAHLLAEIAGGTVAPGIIDVYAHPVQPRTLPFHIDDVAWLLGYTVTPSEVAAALTALQFGVEPQGDGGGMVVTIPTWRGDVQESADVVEEVGRVLGYDRITGSIPAGPLPEPQIGSWFARQERLRDILAGLGLREIVTYPLTSRAAMLNILADPSNAAPLLLGAVAPSAERDDQHVPALGKNSNRGVAHAAAAPGTNLPALAPEQLPTVTLANPLSTRQEALRLTLLVSLLETLGENARQGAAQIRLFEVGRRYIPQPAQGDQAQLPLERRSLGIVLAGPSGDEWLGDQRELDFFDLKGIVEALLRTMGIRGARYTPTQHPTFHPGRTALLELPVAAAADAPTTPVGILGELHPDVAKRYELARRGYALELDLERLFAAAPDEWHVMPISRFPTLTRDIAVVVRREIPSAEVAAAIRAAGAELVQSVTLFDVYEGTSIPADQRSLAFTIVYQATDRTLSDADGDAERAKVVAKLAEQFGAKIRE
ncbi:MAG: phenylalanine--tRNA ligase subunit beta [Ktedonobacterales bacterium]|nr:phenylalanine--tRNA ligase subunit beta [Ktedonobacterales bacterium]